MDLDPQVPELRELKAQLSEKRWQARVKKAHQHLAVVKALAEACPDGVVHRAALKAVAPQVSWTSARRWWTNYHTRAGDDWERLLDRRLPERPWETPPEWKRLVCLLARQDPRPSLKEIRQRLMEVFGEKADLSDGTLAKILKAEGLSARSESRETVVSLSGGGGLVLLLAALEESGIGGALAGALAGVVDKLEAPEAETVIEIQGRDARGRFTKVYNQDRQSHLAEHGGLFGSIDARPGERDLRQLRVSQLSTASLEQHIRALVALPLLTERRGTVGLDGPAGAWLEVLCPVPYRAATLDKTLNQLKVLNVGEALWQAHAQVWWQLSRQWAGEGWRQIVVYIDASKDPWWTHRFATSAPVSRIGRVQPCLSRVALSSGPGVPILVEVGSGQTPIKPVLWSLLDQARAVLGDNAVGRLTVIDAEGCQRELIEAFLADPDRDLLTAFKGSLAQGKTVEACGPWVAFKTGAVREAQVNLNPTKDEALTVRIVEMRRGDDSRPVALRVLSTAPVEALSSVEVLEAYLGRWPYQEDLFRRGRDGLGLDRSAGFGAAAVNHVALLDKRDRAERARERAEHDYTQACEAEMASIEILRPRLERLQQCQAEADTPLDGRQTRPAREAFETFCHRGQQSEQARQALARAEQHCDKLAQQPDTLYVRDTALDTITTCFKMALMALLEFICQEYLDRYRLMPRTFIEAWMALPVTIRQSRYELIYEIAPNPRDPSMTRRLEEALAKITERRIRYRGRRLVARLGSDPKWADSG